MRLTFAASGGRPLRGLLALASCLPVLAGCGYGASRLSHEAQLSMIGMTENDLEACAGPPDKTTTLNPETVIFTYEYKPSANGGFNVELPLSLGGISLGGSGTYCRADMRLVDHRLVELHYTGDDDKAVGNDGVCTPLIRGCMRQPEPTMGDVGGTNYDKSSGYSSPPVPPLPSVAEIPPAPAASTPKK